MHYSFVSCNMPVSVRTEGRTVRASALDSVRPTLKMHIYFLTEL